MKRLRHLRFLRVIGLLVAVLVLAACGTMATRSDTPYRVVAYDTVEAGAPVPDVDKLDVLNFAFAVVRDGRVVLPDDAATRLDQRIALKQDHPHLKVVVSVGGWGAGGFSEAAATPAARQAFADSAARLLVTHHADGLDVDWEYPGSDLAKIGASPDDRANFTALLRTLRETLQRTAATQGRAEPYLLTIASADSQYVDGIDLAAVAPLLDWFNVMTYDFNNSLTPLTGHHSGLYPAVVAPSEARTTSRAVHQYLAAGVPADKIVIGAAFYALRFDGVKPEHDGLYQPYDKFGGAIAWRDLKRDFINRQGYQRHWDDRADAPYLWNPTTRSLIVYDDPASLAAKAGYVKLHHLGGIMFWQAGQDDDGELLTAIREGLQ